MNSEFLAYALKRLDEITNEELYEIGVKCGLDMIIRQYPEPPPKEWSVTLLRHDEKAKLYRRHTKQSFGEDEDAARSFFERMQYPRSVYFFVKEDGNATIFMDTVTGMGCMLEWKFM